MRDRAPGLTDMTAGTYELKWFDPVDGDLVTQTKTLSAGTQTFAKPSAIGSECAVWLNRTDGGGGPPTAGLLAYWNHDQGTGSTVSDSIAPAANGTTSGSVSWVTGQRGPWAVQYTGGHADCGYPTKLDLTGAMTVSAWVKPTTISNADTIVSKKGNNKNGWHLALSSTGKPTFEVAYGATAPGTIIAVTAPTALTAGAWAHITGIYEPGVSVRLYVNGSLVATTTTTQTSQRNSGAQVRIGKRPSNVDPFNGSIDEVRIYNRALTTTEVAALDD